MLPPTGFVYKGVDVSTLQALDYVKPPDVPYPL